MVWSLAFLLTIHDKTILPLTQIPCTGMIIKWDESKNTENENL